MRFKHLCLKNAVFLLIAIALCSLTLTAQKRPENVTLDVNADDMKFCSAQTTFENSRKKSAPLQEDDREARLNTISNQLNILNLRINANDIDEKSQIERETTLRNERNELKKERDKLAKLRPPKQEDTARIQVLDRDIKNLDTTLGEVDKELQILRRRRTDWKNEQDGLYIQQTSLRQEQGRIDKGGKPGTARKPNTNDDDDGRNQLCVLYDSYLNNLKNGNLQEAAYDRNDMIDLVVGQIDAYFKHRKDGRKFKIKIFETVLDFLRIGGELAVAIMNGARAKTIVGAALGGLDAGRTKFDKNFEILATQVLVNKMIAKRLTILTQLSAAKDKPVRTLRATEAYSWNQARNDLQKYLLAGTFDDALDTLVKETGAEAEEAETKLGLVEKRPIITEFTPEETTLVENADAVLATLQEKFTANPADEDVRKRLLNIVDTLKAIQQFDLFFSGRKLTAESKSKDLYDALIDLRRTIFSKNDRNAIRTVEETIIKLGK